MVLAVVSDQVLHISVALLVAQAYFSPPTVLPHAHLPWQTAVRCNFPLIIMKFLFSLPPTILAMAILPPLQCSRGLCFHVIAVPLSLK